MNTQYLAVDAGRLAYDDQGNGPLVICIPSLGDVRQEYRFLAPLLVEAGYRVVTLDVRGHGETSVKWPDYSVAAIGADILALIRHLNAGPALLVGTSMAAGAAVWATAEAPALIVGLVLIGAVVHDMGPLWPGRLLYPLLFARPWGSAVWGKYFSTLYPTQHPADWAQYTAQLRRNLKQPGRLRALQQMIMASKQASGDRLSQVKAPVLVITGTRDPDFKQPAQEAQWVANALQGQVQLIEGAGHYPHAEMPEQTAPHILTFFGTLKKSVAQS